VSKGSEEYNDNCNEAMVAKCVAHTADQVYEDISVCPNMTQSTTISDRDTISLPANTVANYKILSTMNAGDTYEIHECYNSPWSATINNAQTCLFLYVIQVT
jgi:hypothetical protein